MKRAAWAVVVCLVVCAGSVWAQGRQQIGVVKPYQAETPHPYPLGTDARPAVWTERVISPGAAFVRVHFTRFHLAEGDYVTVSSPDGAQVWTYAGRGPHGHGDIWAFAIDGEEAVVTLHGGRGQGFGYVIDAVGHGTVPFEPAPEVVCGTDGREDVACHLPEVDAAQRPVARLLFASQGSLFACTGWMVDGSNANTLMTNNHCIATQTETESLEARFNFQRTTCGGATNAAVSNYVGNTLLTTNSVDVKGRKGGGLDYTLLTLQGTPEADWGEVVATTVPAQVGDLIWFIQHPGGGVKRIGYFEDAAQTTRCKVDLTDQTYGRSAAGSQMAYGCDSEGGSSGSPIIDPATGRAVGLHHFGGVNNNPCLNSATEMAEICADAGPLLNCAGAGGGGCTLLPAGSPCTANSQCCSGNCKGKPGAKTCK